MITPPCYPARPVNGGPLPKAQPKHGDWVWEPKVNGWRAWEHAPTGAMFNRENKPLSIAAEFAPVCARIQARFQAGLTAEFGAWALEAACLAAAAWPATLVVSVNVAAAQLAGAQLLHQVAAALERSALPPERLDLEFGEAVLAEVDLDALLTLSAIRDLGVGLAVDKFGHGLASLSLLRRLPLTTLKLDRALVRDAADNPEDRAILHAIIQTGHALGLCVVADGVETEAQRSLLASLGCDAAQGHLFAAAMPGGVMAARLRQ